MKLQLWNSPADIINTYGLYRYGFRAGEREKKEKRPLDNLNPGNLLHLHSLTPKKETQTIMKNVT